MSIGDFKLHIFYEYALGFSRELQRVTRKRDCAIHKDKGLHNPLIWWVAWSWLLVSDCVVHILNYCHSLRVYRCDIQGITQLKSSRACSGSSRRGLHDSYRRLTIGARSWKKLACLKKLFSCCWQDLIIIKITYWRCKNHYMQIKLKSMVKNNRNIGQPWEISSYEQKVGSKMKS